MCRSTYKYFVSEKSKIAEVKSLYDICRPYIKGFRTALDIGCDVFHFASVLEQDFKHIHCFDFRDKSSQMGKAILDTKKITHHVTGLGESKAVRYSKTGVGRIKSDHPKGNSTLAVPITTLDSFELFDDVDFIKMDVEGYEPKVIKGGLETIRRNSPVILCEINRGDLEAKLLLEDIGYRCVHVHYKESKPHDFVFVID